MPVGMPVHYLVYKIKRDGQDARPVRWLSPGALTSVCSCPTPTPVSENPACAFKIPAEWHQWAVWADARMRSLKYKGSLLAIRNMGNSLYIFGNGQEEGDMRKSKAYSKTQKK